MDPVRISVVFDAQGQPQLQRAAQSLTQLTTQLTALTANSTTAGRALRVMEADLNRFAYTLNRTVTQGLHTFNTAFERTYSLFTQVSRISFYAALGQVAALTYGLKGLGQQFFSINEQFSGLEITLKSMFGSLTAARKVREELARITINSPLAFKDLADATRSAAAMPALAPRFASQISSNTIGDPNGFLRKYIGLLEKMTTFRPDKTTSDAVFALREAIGGELRSLVRRFEFPASLLVQASGKPLDYLKSRPEEMLQAMTTAFNRMISDKATLEIARQPSKLWSNIIEQALQIPLLQIGRAGEKDGKTSFYQHILDTGVTLLNRFGEFADVDKGPFGVRSKEIGSTLTRLFDQVLGKLDNTLERGLKYAGASPTDVPGAGKIERTYFVFQKIIEYISDNFPRFTAGVEGFITKTKPLFNFFIDTLNNLVSVLKKAFDFGPFTGLATIGVLKNLPSVFGGAMRSAGDTMVTTMTNIRGALSSFSVGPLAQSLSALKASGIGATTAAPAMTLGGTSFGNNSFLYNRALLQEVGMDIDYNGRLRHVSGKVDAPGYFGNTYSAQAGQFVGYDQMPNNLIYRAGMRPEEQMARLGMVRDPITNSTVWGLGSGMPVGAPVSAGLMGRLTRGLNSLDMRGLPEGVIPGPNGTYRSAITGMTVASAPVMASMIANVNQPMGFNDVRSRMYNAMKNNGSGVMEAGLSSLGGAIGSSLGLGTRGVAVAAGVGAGASAMAAAIAPIAIALVSTALIEVVVNKVSAFIERKRSEAGEDRMNAIGLGKDNVTAMQSRIIGEATFAREVGQFAKDARINPALAQYLPGISSVYEQSTVAVPTYLTLGTRKKKEMRGGNEWTTLEDETFASGELTRNRKMDLAGLVALRTKIVADIEALTAAAHGPETLAKPIELQSISAIMRDGAVGPAHIASKSDAEAAVRVVREFYASTAKIAEDMFGKTGKALTTANGKPIFSVGANPSESLMAQLDGWKTTLSQLSSVSGVIDSTKSLEKIKEGQKMWEISPDFRQITESNEGLLTGMLNQTAPFRELIKVFSRDETRIQGLQELLGSISEMKSNGQIDKAIEDQVKVLNDIQSQFKLKFGDEGLRNISVDVPTLNADGTVAKIDKMLFTDYVEHVRKGLIQLAPEISAQLETQTRDSLFKIPAGFLETIALHVPQHLEKIATASMTLSGEAVDQTIELINGMRATLAKSYPKSNFDAKITPIIEALQSLPSMEGALTPPEQNTVAVSRISTFLKVAKLMQDLTASVQSETPVTAQATFDVANKAVAEGIKKWTASANSLADSLTKGVMEMQLAQQGRSFGLLMSGDIQGKSALGKVQIDEAVTYAKRRYGITINRDSLSFLDKPLDSERTGGAPFQREQGLLNVQTTQIIPSLKKQIADLTAAQSGLISDDPQLLSENLTKIADLNEKLRSEEEATEVLRRTITKGMSEWKMNRMSSALESMRAMTDPELGYKLTRRGTADQKVQWNTGNFGSDARLAQLQRQFDRDNAATGGNFRMTDEFKAATNIDVRGFKAVTGEVQRLTAFENQYLEVAKEINRMMADPRTTEDQRANLEKMAESWSKMAENARRTKESITGSGGLFTTMTDGFGAVVSQWEATAQNWTSVGAGIANSLSSNLSDALINIAVHAKDAGEAFKQFGFNVAETAARLAMNKVVEQILGSLIGSIAGGALGSLGGHSNSLTISDSPNPGGTDMGSMIGRAAGGLIPGPSSDVDNRLAKVATGEYIIPASAVRKFGAAHFDAYRGYASGGLVGNLPVNSAPSFTGGMPVNAPVSVTVNIDQSGNAKAEQTDPQTSEAKSRLLAESLSATVRDQLIREQRQGGVLYNMVRANRK